MLRALKPSDGPKEARFGPTAILEEINERVPKYLDDVDQGKLIYPACRRALSDRSGDTRSVWEDTRLEAMRYVTMVPGREFDLLVSPARQMEMIDAYLFQRAHAETVIDFTGTAPADFAIAILAGLNWLTHCAHLASVPWRSRRERYVVSGELLLWHSNGGSPKALTSVANN
jgi:hypothetical protein